MSVLIIEGCDASGKSTLIEVLRQYLTEYSFRKGSSFEQSKCNNKELMDNFSDLLFNESAGVDAENIVFDRFIYSNEVYASLYDDYAILTDKQRRDIEFWISHEGAIIYLTAPAETLQERLNKRGDDYVKAERIPAILEKYEASLSAVEHLPIFRFDTSKQTTEDIVKFILNNVLDEDKKRNNFI